jgi:hypothetical protein
MSITPAMAALKAAALAATNLRDTFQPFVTHRGDLAVKTFSLTLEEIAAVANYYDAATPAAILALLTQLEAQAAPSRTNLTPMAEDDGSVRQWYFDCAGHYIDVALDDGKYSILFRDRGRSGEAWLDQADVQAASPPDSTGGAEPDDAQAFLESMKPRANKIEAGTRFWTGWALVEAYKAGAAAQPVQAAPAGWKLVPIEPTEEMISAGDVHMDGVSQLGDAWGNMLASAPEFAPEPPQ